MTETDPIRRFLLARADDEALNEIVALRRRFWASQYEFGHHPTQSAGDEHLAARTAAQLRSRHHVFVVARCHWAQSAPLQAYALGSRRVTPGYHGGRIGIIEEFFVVPETRRCGLGEGLYLRVRSELTTLGIDRLELTVLTANLDAQKFWRKRGFEPYSMLLWETGATAPPNLTAPHPI